MANYDICMPAELKDSKNKCIFVHTFLGINQRTMSDNQEIAQYLNVDVRTLITPNKID